ncbi:MAG: hypothetical protein K0A90_00160 [Methanosarcinaceae archaeon]|nr:hypothetical protein [Methanosarcinaceae archaeon]
MDFVTELETTKGISKKTSKDIISQFPTRDILINSIQNKKHLPYRNDVVEKLFLKYGDSPKKKKKMVIL